MNGIDSYNNRFDRMSRNKIDGSDEGWMLNGFYNSLIIKRSYKTAYQYLLYVVAFLNETGATASSINVDDYYSFMASLKNKSCSEQIGAYHALQKYSRYLESRKVSEDYMKYIERPKFVETQETIDKREKGFLTKTETKKMINKVLDSNTSDTFKARNYAIMMIFLTTGIRCSALYKLDLSDVDLEEGTITVLEKGNKNRKIDIPPQTIEAINIWIGYRYELLGKERMDEDALIISSARQRMTTDGIYKLIKNIGKIITGKNITPHKLRATYGTQLYSKTKDLYFVQSCMGHTSPKTTELYIRGKKSEYSKKAAVLIGDFID